MPIPRWYCPPGVDRPAHLPMARGLACLRQPETVGPEGAPPGGVTWGGRFVAGEQGWQATAAGWWINLHDDQGRPATPADLLRVEALPGSHVGDLLIPRLLNPDGTYAGPRFLVVGADGGLGFAARIDPTHAELVTRLRAVLALDDDWHQERERWAAEFAQLAVALIAINHHLTAHELAAWGWLQEPAAAAIPFAACGLDEAAIAAQEG